MAQQLVFVAGPIASFVLRRMGFSGCAMPWGRAYIVPEWFDDEMLHVHELHHLEQMKRDGVVVFLVRYFWWLAKYGYANNPYEIEARQRAEYGVTAEEVKRKGLVRPAWMSPASPAKAQKT